MPGCSRGDWAAFTEQWWWLKGYQQLGETSLFLSMLGVGIIATAFTPTGFVATDGPRRKVVLASLAMLLAVGLAAMVSVQFRGDVNGLRCFRSLPCPGSIACWCRP
jgi:hypothetical protein